ncbi:MAG: UMP kinase [Waddliaceae bacterium]|jgi:uridylate kinase|nr:UMP kinase [Waddliaceae bacterium]MBT3579512.1 UMP kinase [Waddliaceae bacterium]MBT4445001.1 UMP kinase [Waddliaceae bacterium]MBT6928264.1 UMP kinase [Waddliaceae bacterium]MBT7264555.1 UMP kinase [Waddliaceae bacterium]
MGKDHEYKRVLLKVSGEALVGSKDSGVDIDVCNAVAHSIKELHDSGKEVAIVVGGGNFFRGSTGVSLQGMNQSAADNIGMLATIINGLLLKHSLEEKGCEVRVMSALECPKAVEPFIREKAIQHLEARRIVIFVGGTGNPFFTTDTAAALRAGEIEAQLLIKATKVDGIYDKDPNKYDDAVKYETLTYSQAIEEKLKIMDLTAFTLCMENKIPIFVCDIFEDNGIVAMIENFSLGTIVKGE